VNLVREVEIDNALNGSAAFITNSKVKAKLATTPKQSSGVEGKFLLFGGGDGAGDRVLGYPIAYTNSIPSNLTKGSATSVCSAILFGVWQNLVIGQWSGVDLLVDPFSGSKEATVRVTAFHDADVADRNAENFSACVDVTTACRR